MKPVERDSDGDGLLDEEDRCPGEPEDADSFEDGDGCPDPDNDGDELLDPDDGCPNEAETRNGIEDGDGCPDEEPKPPAEPPKLVEIKDDQIVIADQIHFETGKAKIGKVSFGTLDAMAKMLTDDPAITLRIEGHTDTRGKAEFNRKLSDRRAKAVMEYLIGQGIAAARLTARGFGPDRPLEDNGTAEGRAKNRRVEFHITGR
jgi:outer membrane protein OmpA-like peptidoglycan-associated protein